MKYTVPAKLESVLLSYIKETYLPKRFANPKHAHQFNAMDVKFFARGVADMSRFFTCDRSDLPKNYLNKKELLAGYLLYFVPTNFLKVKFCLEEACAKERFDTKEIIKIADLGCGPGTASLACVDHWRTSSKQKLHITAIDQNSHALHDAKRVIGAYMGDNVELATRLSDVHSKNVSACLRGRYDIIIAANFLSEIKDVARRSEIARQLISDHLTDDGILIVIEPALRHTSRELMYLHDALSSYSVIAPCMHNGPCPMLISSSRDWCHMYLEWERPEIIQKVDMMIGNRKDYLKFSYLIMSGKAPRPAATASARTFWRVVSAPMNSKGKTELLLCSEKCGTKGLMRVTRQDKDESEANSDFSHVWRGQIVSYDGGQSMTKETPFKIIPR